MKHRLLVFMAFCVLLFCNSAWEYCPQDTLDRGQCDTIYIEPWSSDVADSVWSRPGPYFVKVPIYITDDIYTSYDSIRAFVIPLCYTHDNPAKYCSVSSYWNKAFGTLAYTSNRGIFRDLPNNSEPSVYNWMKQLWDIGEGQEWDFVTLDLDGSSQFWLALIATGPEDEAFSAGSRLLLATMTMKLEDTMRICIDTCFWPPNSHLSFVVNDTNGAGVTKIPRSSTGTSSFRVCFGLVGAPLLTVTSPNGGEEWCAQSTHDITWDCYEKDKVGIEYSTDRGTTWMTKIDYSTNGGSAWMTIVSSVPCSNGRYTWTVPNTIGSTCLISVCDVPQTNCDLSDGYFSIIQCHPGDVTGDGVADIGDVIYLINYLYKGGSPPDPLANGDVNADCLVDVGDVVYFINYLFKNGDALRIGCT
jgi:hypothetical protein